MLNYLTYKIYVHFGVACRSATPITPHNAFCTCFWGHLSNQIYGKIWVNMLWSTHKSRQSIIVWVPFLQITKLLHNCGHKWISNLSSVSDFFFRYPVSCVPYSYCGISKQIFWLP
jgi:hypothetical protein